MARKIPKALIHPDGELFVVWHPKLKCYSPVISDDEYPTAPEDLNLRSQSITDLASLRWAPVRILTEDIVISGTSLGPYDDGEDE